MNITVKETAQTMGEAAAKTIAAILRSAIVQKGYARLVLSTGASQFSTLEALVQQDVDWSCVTMFHLDEYVHLPESHPASFRKYLKDRFLAKIPLLGEAVFVNGEAPDITQELARLTQRLQEDEIDVGVIGIGENAHIAFNDPPADFETTEAYIVVTLNERCKQQQVGEGWFATLQDVPTQAISMTCHQIMACNAIVSPVPNTVKANAISAMLAATETNNIIPATLLKEHKNFHLYLDKAAAALCAPALL